MEFKWRLSVNKWSEVNWSDVEWNDVIYVKWFCFEFYWREASYEEILGDKSNMHIIVSIYWTHFFIVTILFCLYLVLWLFEIVL